MEESKIHDTSSTQDTSVAHSVPESQTGNQPAVQTPQSIYIFLYDSQLKSSPLITHLLSLEVPASKFEPYLLAAFMLRPVENSDNLELGLFLDEKQAFGVLGQIYQIQVTSLQNAEYQGNNLKNLFLSLKERGDVKEISGEAYKYLYNVGEINKGPIFTLTKEGNTFSGQGSLNVSETFKTKGKDVVAAYYQFLKESFGNNMALAGINYIKVGIEKNVTDASVVSSVFDNYVSTLEKDQVSEYTFDKNLAEDQKMEAELERFFGNNLLSIPEVIPDTGDFNWSSQRDFTKHHMKPT